MFVFEAMKFRSGAIRMILGAALSYTASRVLTRLAKIM